MNERCRGVSQSTKGLVKVISEYEKGMMGVRYQKVQGVITGFQEVSTGSPCILVPPT